jgi:hypothetical protein
MEASGWSLTEVPNFTPTVRIAPVAGGASVDIPAAAFAASVGSSRVTWAEPVGWLDTDTLLVVVHCEDWNTPSLVTVQADGSIGSLFAQGTFMGFFYP